VPVILADLKYTLAVPMHRAHTRRYIDMPDITRSFATLKSTGKGDGLQKGEVDI
jgi:hypothetical protein